jgi:hypothetical protein
MSSIQVHGVCASCCFEVFHHRLLDRVTVISLSIYQNARVQITEDDSLNYVDDGTGHPVVFRVQY